MTAEFGVTLLAVLIGLSALAVGLLRPVQVAHHERELSDQMYALKVEHSQLKNELATLRATNASLQATIRILQERDAQREGEMVVLRDEVFSLRQLRRELESEMKGLRRALEVRN